MKSKLLFLILSVAILSSCENQQKVKTLNNEQANIAVANKLFEHFNRHEWKKMADLSSDTAEFRDPALGPNAVKQSRQQISEKYTDMAKMFPDITDEVRNIYPSGDKNVIVEFISSATAPDGTKWALPICTIFTIENGIITKDYTYYDNQQ